MLAWRLNKINYIKCLPQSLDCWESLINVGSDYNVSSLSSVLFSNAPGVQFSAWFIVADQWTLAEGMNIINIVIDTFGKLNKKN